MPNYEKLVVPVFLAMTGLGISLILNPPLVWLLAIVTVVLVCIGTDGVIRSHPRIYLRNVGYTLTFWILPGLLTMGASMFLRLLPPGPMAILGLLLSGVLLTIVILAEYHIVDKRDSSYRLARLFLNISSYMAALALYSAIYSVKVRSIQSATSILIISTLLAAEILKENERNAVRIWLYALVAGLVVGETTWGLNYWPIGGVAGGFFLVVVFYLVTGLIQRHFLSKLTKTVVAEYSFVAFISFMFLFSSRFWVH
ncbi:MAG: hypothetical protein Q7O66_20370 [Dehalococcoidia bacterium]|nr:hypothetical protein [Dehalococcoidia bacterium]